MASFVEDYDIDVQADTSDNAKTSLTQTKSPAWNKPSNDVVVEISPVMGAVSWPALSDSARALPKASSDSLKTDGSVSIPQGSVMESAPKDQLTSNANPNSSQNNAFPAHQKSSNVVVPDSSPKDTQKRNNSDGEPRGKLISQPSHVNNHPQHPNSSRKNNYGGRRYQDRTNSDWNSNNRSFKGRGFEMQHQQQRKVVPRSFVAPPPLSPQQYHGPGPIGPLANGPSFPMLFPTSFAPHVPVGYYFSPLDPQLRDKVVKQIEYYFSEENLCKDTYLRQNMDGQGLVSIYLIAGFHRVKQLTNDILFILDALRFSNIVEIQGDKIRRKNDWMKWLLRPSNHQFSSLSGAQFQGISNSDAHALASRIENLGLEGGKTTNNSTMRSLKDTHNDIVLGRSSTEP